MTDCEKEEAHHLHQEFQWILDEEVHAVFLQLHSILNECVRRFPVPLCGNEGTPKPEKYSLTTVGESLKCNIVLTGDTITFGEISFKVQRHQTVIHRTTITNENYWKLQQIQDAGNHLHQALRHINNVEKGYHFKSSEEVLNILGKVLGALQRGRTSLIVPRKRTMDDLMKSRNMKMLVPNLPEDLAISFYIQSHKVVFAIYQVTSDHGTMTFNTQQAEATVPWLNEVLVLFTVALQIAQQLKDKLSVFAQYKDFHFAQQDVDHYG